MKFRDLPINSHFRFTPRKDAFPTEVISSLAVYQKIDKRGYSKAFLPEGHPCFYFKVGTINVQVEEV